MWFILRLVILKYKQEYYVSINYTCGKELNRILYTTKQVEVAATLHVCRRTAQQWPPLLDATTTGQAHPPNLPHDISHPTLHITFTDRKYYFEPTPNSNNS